MADTPQKLVGDTLRVFVRKSSDDIRTASDTRPKHSIIHNLAAMAANRTIGKSLASAAIHARSFMVDAGGTGIFVGLSFTVDQLDQATADLHDRQATETTVGTLAQDAHAETIDAKGRVAWMIVQTEQTRRAVLSNPGVSLQLKAQVKTAGADLEADFTDANATRTASTKQTLANRDSLNLANVENDKLNEELAVKTVRSDIKIQYLQGEPIRPEDVDGALSAAGKDLPAQPSSSTGKSRSKPHTPRVTPAVPPSPKGQGRRKSPRNPSGGTLH